MGRVFVSITTVVPMHHRGRHHPAIWTKRLAVDETPLRFRNVVLERTVAAQQLTERRMQTSASQLLPLNPTS